MNPSGNRRGRLREVSGLALLLALNGTFGLRILGVQYDSFSWEVAAQTYYYSTPTPSATPSIAPSTTPTRTPSGSENEGGPSACSDGIDNDNNGATDCADSACAMTPPCLSSVPVVSGSGIAAIVVLLGLIAMAALTRPRPRPE